MNTAPSLTDAGRNFFLRSVAGEIITFSSIKIGNGEITGIDPDSLRGIVNPILSFGITSTDVSEAGYVKVTGKFDSSMIESDFRWRELGLYAQGEKKVRFMGNGVKTTFALDDEPPIVTRVRAGAQEVEFEYDSDTFEVTLDEAPAQGVYIYVYYPEGEEVLYAYANDGDMAGMLRANLIDVVSEQIVSFIVAIGDATGFKVILSQSQVYALKSDLDAHLAADNPHGIDKISIGLGNVDNVSTNNQTVTYSYAADNTRLTSGEKMSTAFGKIARAISSLISHLSNKDNPHEVTCEGIGAAGAEHTHSCVDITKGILPVERGGTGGTTVAAFANLIKNYLFAPNAGGLIDIAVPIGDKYLSEYRKLNLDNGIDNAPAGFYAVNNASEIENNPSQAEDGPVHFFFLLAVGGGNGTTVEMQIAIIPSHYSGPSNGKMIYIRDRNSSLSDWSEWKNII